MLDGAGPRRENDGMDIVLSILVLAAIALFAGAFALWRKGVRRQAGLMVLLGVVALVNVAIWTVPTASGDVPLDQLATERER